MLVAMVYMGGHISGGQYNPAVTLGVMLRGRQGAIDCFVYVLSQTAGALAGGKIAMQIADAVFTAGFPAKHPDSSNMNAIFLEALGTFFLVTSVLASATRERNNVGNPYYGIAIGFTVMVCAYAFGPISGGAFNPAVGLIPVLHHKLDTVWVYWAGPMIGAVAAAIMFWLTNPLETFDVMTGLSDNDRDFLMGSAAKEDAKYGARRNKPRASSVRWGDDAETTVLLTEEGLRAYGGAGPGGTHAPR